ncbi:hypothetical protein EB151_04255 [archaeon]|nr:hypothetical protein [archaeon]
MSEEWWPDNPAEVDSFGLYSYYEINYAKKVMREWKDSKDSYHRYEVIRARKILENEGYNPDNFSPLKYIKKNNKVLDNGE